MLMESWSSINNHNETDTRSDTQQLRQTIKKTGQTTEIHIFKKKTNKALWIDVNSASVALIELFSKRTRALEAEKSTLHQFMLFHPNHKNSSKSSTIQTCLWSNLFGSNLARQQTDTSKPITWHSWQRSKIFCQAKPGEHGDGTSFSELRWPRRRRVRTDRCIYRGERFEWAGRRGHWEPASQSRVNICWTSVSRNKITINPSSQMWQSLTYIFCQTSKSLQDKWPALTDGWYITRVGDGAATPSPQRPFNHS